jgi:hypothetical protein
MANRHNQIVAAVLVIVSLVLLKLFSEGLGAREGELKGWDARRVAERDSQWAQEKADHDQAAQLADAQRQARHLAQLTEACGGPAAFVVKNPAYPIWQMLEQLTKAGVPAGSKVQVRVDRFIEFAITVELPRAATPRELAEWSQFIVGPANEYVYDLRFVYKNTVVGALDRPMIDSVPDWLAVSLDEIASRFFEDVSPPDTPMAQDAPNTNSQPANPEDELESTRNFREAQTAFYNDENYQIDALRKFHNLCASAYAWGPLSSVDRLHDKEQELVDGEKAFADARSFIENMPAEYEHRLLVHNVNPQIVAIASRGFQTRQDSSLPVLEQLLKADSGYEASVMAFLKAMEPQWGSWQAKQDGERLLFTFQTADARETYLTASKQLQDANTEFQKAWQAWQTWVQKSAEKTSAAQ